MKKLLIVLGSIIIFNGAFSCSATSSGGNADYAVSRQTMCASIQTILKDTRFQYRDNLHWIKWILEKISYLFHRAKTRGIKSDHLFVNAVFKWLSILAVIALPFIMLYLMRHFFNHNLQLKRPKMIISPAEIITELKKVALSMSEEGKYRDAIHYLYLAGLECIKDDGILPDANRYSDKENLKTLKKLLGANHGQYLAFSSLVMIFREKWYGMKNCRENDYLLAIQYLSAIVESKE